jgi:putative transposase
MPQSLVSNYIHLVFSTKHRQPLIDTDIEDELHRYIGGICEGMDCQPIQTGGAYDHIHSLFLLNKNLTLVKAVEQIKSHSSGWIKTKGEAYKNFYWQSGYGAFSVNPYEVNKVVEYILNQREHHRRISFQDELRAFLKKYSVEFDERYLWD